MIQIIILLGFNLLVWGTLKMDRTTGRPNHIQDYLIQLHPNQWFTWTDSKNKVYANLQLTEKYGG